MYIICIYTCVAISAGSPACFVDVSGMMLGQSLVFDLALLSCEDFGFVSTPASPFENVLSLHTALKFKAQ